MKIRVLILALVCALLSVDLGALSWADGSYTTQQTGTALWTPGGNKRVVVTSVDIQCSGSTLGTINVWFGALADTTFTQGTDQPVTFFDCNTPSATNAPTKFVPFPAPLGSIAPDFILRVTTSAGITVRVIVQGYEQ